MLKQGTSEQYDEIFDAASAVLKQFDPCKWKDGNCAAKSHGCCQGCEHLGPEGCTVKAIDCRVWLCYEVCTTPEGRAANNALQPLRQEIYKLNFWGIRLSKEQIMARSNNG